MVKGVSCPNCKRDTGNEINGELLGPEVKRKFECNNCGHTWDVVI